MLYNLSFIQNAVLNKDVDEEYKKYYTIRKYTTKSNEEYHIIRYTKEMLSPDLYPLYGLLRSVIVYGSKIVSFSPPKSILAERFMTKYPNPNSDLKKIVAEQFIEGTMINVFHNGSFWQIATKNSVGAEVSFYTGSKKTFHDMFFEACKETNLNFLDMLNPAYIYSFVMQHPDNKFVAPVTSSRLFLVAVYEIRNGYEVVEHDLESIKANKFITCCFPGRYEFETYSDLINQFASPNTPYHIMGVIVKNVETGERTKFRNPIYEEVRYLRGNQPKLMYQYLTLRQQGKISEYLRFFPEAKHEFSTYREQVHMFTDTLHKNYISCYVKKEKKLADFPHQYRTNMFKIHELYLNDLREKKMYVSNRIVMNYVNTLNPSLLMYCLNYNLRKRDIDVVKTNHE